MRKIMFGAIVGSLMAASSAIAGEVTIRVHYAIPNLWANVQEMIAAEFMAKNPDIKIEVDAPAETYADGVQRLLRESVAGNLPDLASVGLNRWRILESRGLTVELGQLIGDPGAFSKMGYTPALRSLGQFKDKQYAVAVSASTLVIYVNPKLVAQVGGSTDKFPTDFDGLIDLAARINKLDGTTDGIWVAAHDWRFQSLLGSHGGRPMNADETAITFDSDAGIAAATL